MLDWWTTTQCFRVEWNRMRRGAARVANRLSSLFPLSESFLMIFTAGIKVFNWPAGNDWRSKTRLKDLRSAYTNGPNCLFMFGGLLEGARAPLAENGRHGQTCLRFSYGCLWRWVIGRE